MKANDALWFKGPATLMAVLLAGSLAACSSEADGPVTSEEAEALELWTLVEDDASERTEAGADVAPAWVGPGVAPADGTPGESVDGAVEKAGCVHIQWCNEPGPVGTVCIWDSCSLAAAVRECTADANAVCGGIVQPAEIR